MANHVVFLRDAPLRDVLAGRKRSEFRLSFRHLACEPVRKGDVLLLKRVGGEVEAACNAGEVSLYRDLSPEEVANVARRYGIEPTAPYFGRYTPPLNMDRPVNVAVIELLDVRRASLPPDETPRGVRSGWLAGFDVSADAHVSSIRTAGSGAGQWST